MRAARDDYPYVAYDEYTARYPTQYTAMVDEIDRLRAKNERLRAEVKAMQEYRDALKRGESVKVAP